MVGKELSGFIADDMRVEDLPEVLAIEKASFQTPWSADLFSAEIRKPISVVRVVKKNGRVVGYLCSNIVLDEGHILNLAVHPEFRRHGIASRLIGEMLDIMAESSCRSVFLEVRISNEEARKMYEKFGFGLLATRRNYYVSPVEDAVVMVLRFAGKGKGTHMHAGRRQDVTSAHS
jgi:ribosomal-protein-alanine N-acetyltransferase